MKRVFLAIKIPDEISQKLSRFQNEIKKLDIDAKFVEEENFHINIKFFGNISDKKLKDILDVLNDLVKSTRLFEVDVQGVGIFPSEEFVRVLWAGAQSEGLRQLHTIVEAKLEELGIPKDERRFTPHVTLARIRNPRNKEMFLDKIRENYKKEFGSFTALSMSLFESKLSKQGPTYGVIKEFRFK